MSELSDVAPLLLVGLLLLVHMLSFCPAGARAAYRCNAAVCSTTFGWDVLIIDVIVLASQFPCVESRGVIEELRDKDGNDSLFELPKLWVFYSRMG